MLSVFKEVLSEKPEGEKKEEESEEKFVDAESQPTAEDQDQFKDNNSRENYNKNRFSGSRNSKARASRKSSSNNRRNMANEDNLERGEQYRARRARRNPQDQSILGYMNRDWNNLDPSCRVSCIGLTFVSVVVLIIVLIAASYSKVQATEVGLEYDRINPQLYKDVVDQGLKNKPTFGDIIIWPSKFQAIGGEEGQVNCNSKDGIYIELHVTFQYTPRRENLYDLTLRHKNFENFHNLIVIRAQSTMKQACGDFTADDFQQFRNLVSETMAKKVKEALGGELYHCDMKDLQLVNILRPEDFEKVVEDKENAKADFQLATKERAQEITAAETVVLVADQTAAKTIDLAETERKITLADSEAEAEIIKNRYKELLQVYGDVKSQYDFNTKGILSYISNEIFSGPEITLAATVPSRITFNEASEL